MKHKYLFETKRLGFRNWLDSDLTEFAALNADEEVMKHFPSTLSTEESANFIGRLKNHYSTNKFTYFAVEILATNEFIGFIGLAKQTFSSPFTPAVDIGWRLKKSAWGNGYATEGARRVLIYGFEVIQLSKVIATCVLNNEASENIMRKIGMKREGEFKHEKLKNHPDYEDCLWYSIENTNL